MLAEDISYLSSALFVTKVSEIKGRNAAQSIPTRKKREHGDKSGSNNPDAGNFLIFSSKGLTADDREELDLLKGQVEDLQRKLLEKEESLKSADVLKNQMNAIRAELDNLKLQTSEKDSLIKTTQRQLSDAKVLILFYFFITLVDVSCFPFVNSISWIVCFVS